MSTLEIQLKPWAVAEFPTISSSSSPAKIVELGRHHLSKRDMKAIVNAFENENYEMAATFIWTKAASVLKRQISTLGMEFVGEMLGRQDLNEDSDPSLLSDQDALSLAEDLRIISSTQGLRLSHALGLVRHFTKLGEQDGEQEEMDAYEAVSLLKYCVQAILSQPNFDGAQQFAEFRKSLSTKTLRAEECTLLSESPYFFLRTTLSVLLALIKTGKSATLEHAVGNLIVVLPVIWPKLRQTEKWQVGQAYAEVNSEGNRTSSAGLKTALLKVHGFDFVPESLRSNTFTEAAARVLSAHQGYNNYFNEAAPMRILAGLGTAIPKPAFAKCMEATLAVCLGNSWGHSWASAEVAATLLDSLREEQWEYYLNECLPRDRTVLDKLARDDSPIKRWCELSQRHDFPTMSISNKKVKRLIFHSEKNDFEGVKKVAHSIRVSIVEH